MSIRSFFQRNSKFSAPAAVLILVLALSIVFFNARFGGPEFPSSNWMFDLNTGRLVEAPIDTIAPSDLGSGQFSYPELGDAGSTVDVMIYSCGQSNNKVRAGMAVEDLAEVGAYIGFLARLPNDKLAAAQKRGIQNLPAGGMLVSDATGQNWVKEGSRKSELIAQAISDQCGGGLPKLVRAP